MRGDLGLQPVAGREPLEPGASRHRTMAAVMGDEGRGRLQQVHEPLRRARRAERRGDMNEGDGDHGEG